MLFGKAEQALRDKVAEFGIQVARLEVQLESEKTQKERLELEYERLRQDFNELSRITAGRVPPKLAPEFDKDPWRDDPSLPETYLTPDPDDLDMTIEAAQELVAQTNGEGTEGREREGSGEPSGY